MKAALALSVALLAVLGGLVAARGDSKPPQPDPLLRTGAERYAAFVREETRSLHAAANEGDGFATVLYRGRIAPSTASSDPVVATLAAVSILSEDARGNTDLLDIEGHAAGAAAAFDGIRDAVWARDRGLVGSVDDRIQTVRDELDRHRRGGGYDDELAPSERRSLAAALDGLAWRLSVAARQVR